MNLFPDCPHDRLKFVETPAMIHFGKEVCAGCGKFIRWIPKKANQERDAQNALMIEKLRGRDLNEWEKGFVLSLEKKGRHFSPNQQNILNQLWREHGS